MTQEQKDKINKLNLTELRLVAIDAKKLVEHYYQGDAQKWRVYYAHLVYIQNRRRELMKYAKK